MVSTKAKGFKLHLCGDQPDICPNLDLPLLPLREAPTWQFWWWWSTSYGDSACHDDSGNGVISKSSHMILGSEEGRRWCKCRFVPDQTSEFRVKPNVSITLNVWHKLGGTDQFCSFEAFQIKTESVWPILGTLCVNGFCKKISILTLNQDNVPIKDTCKS